MPVTEITTKRSKRTYTAEDRGSALAVLQSNGGNILKTSRETGIPYHTLREWAANGRGVTPEVIQIQQVKAGGLAEKFEHIAHLCADHLSQPGVIAKGSPLAVAKIGGISVDKSQLLTGRPTSITGAVMSDDEKRIRLAELLARIAERNPPSPERTGHPSP